MATREGLTTLELARENDELRTRLAEAEDTLRAIREGEVDAVIVSGSRGEQVFSLTGADLIYRLIVETMSEAALTVSLEGRVLFCNRQFCELVGVAPEQIVGHRLHAFVPPEQQEALASLLFRSQREVVRQRLVFRGPDGVLTPARVSACILRGHDGPSLCLVATNLTELEASTELVQQLEARGAELALSEQRFRVALADKEVLLKEVHHRVKNNLQIISSLLGLQQDGVTDLQVRNMLEDARGRVRTMALVHEKLYGTPDLDRVELAGYARSLLSSVWRTHGSLADSVRLTLELAPAPVPIAAAVPCGLILNELASNTLKHAFRGRDAGQVTVTLQVGEAGRLFLSVRDDGVGMQPGFDWRGTKSLGLRLVQMLTDQLGGTLEVRPVPEGGTEFEVAFALPA